MKPWRSAGMRAERNAIFSCPRPKLRNWESAKLRPPHMSPRSTIASLALAQALAMQRVFAQPNLPPPPPPPIGQPGDLPPPRESAPPRPSPTPSPAPPRPPPSSVPQRRSPPPPAPASPTGRASHRQREVVYVVEGEGRPAIAATLNVLPLFLGRLSGNLEVLVAPHHAFIASPNLLFLHVDRGGRYNLASEGLGFVTRTSASFGIELGYHYFWQWQRTLNGLFFGPALLLGLTTDASVGDPSHAQGYWGLAVDVGVQEVLSNGLTLGAGAGLGFVRMSDAAVFPRLLLQVGWSF